MLDTGLRRYDALRADESFHWAVGIRMTATRSGSTDPRIDRKNGALEEIRTPDPQIRSLVLYPAELRARTQDLLERLFTQCKRK
jgi:hypothetical protein